MWFQVLPLSTFSVFDERRALAWRFAAALVLLIAMLTVGRAPYNALFLMGMAITAGLISILLETHLGVRDGKSRVPASALALWWAIASIVSLHTGFPSVIGQASFSSTSAFGLPPSMLAVKENLWLLLSLAGIGFSLGFNGSRALLGAMSFVFLAAGLASYHGVARGDLLDAKSILLLMSYAAATSVLMFRFSRAMTNRLQSSLGGLVLRTSDAKTRLNKQTDELSLIREGLLGSSDLQGEQAGPGLVEWVKNRNMGLETLQILERPKMTFEELVHDARTAFQEFQIEGRKQGEVLGPVRFVFFPPAAGYDEKADVSVDREALREGLRACLRLAYESLPESAGHRREGVVRLSIRRGLRVVEIAVEDNGRGLSNQNLEVESRLRRLRESVEMQGGRFDRIARLGVGGRTSMELKILRQLPRSAKYRPTLRHVGTAAELESLTGAEPLSHSEI